MEEATISAGLGHPSMRFLLGVIRKSMYVMLIWVGVVGNLHSGAAAIIPGFASMDACENAMPRVHQFYDGTFYKATIECVSLSTTVMK